MQKYDTAFILIRRITDSAEGRALHSIEWQNPGGLITIFAPSQYTLTMLLGLQYQLSVAVASGDTMQQQRIATHLATAEGRYDFVTPAYLNTMYPDVLTTPFSTWLSYTWAAIP